MAAVTRAMPKQRPGKSEQTVCTPREFISAVERRFGMFVLDLAATSENRICLAHLGPGSHLAEDALSVAWDGFGGNLWLNPPFRKIGAWAAKCAAEAKKGARICMLVPFTVANWYRDHVHGKALVLGLSPRIKFVGHKSCYPKDLALIVWGPYVAPGFDVWRWRP